VAFSPIASQLFESLDIHPFFASEITFDLIGLIDVISDAANFTFCHFMDASIRIDIRVFEDIFRTGIADTIDIRQCDFDAFISG
jgi:hypothetical protein